jgi:hypothetical protein
MPTQTPKPPLNTYIPWAEGIARKNWYIKHKRPILDNIVQKYNPGHDERESFYYSDPRVISDLLGHILKKPSYMGLRIYFGSCLDKIPQGCEVSDKGKLVLIFVPIINEKEDLEEQTNENETPFKDSDEYYKLLPTGCVRVSLTRSIFDELVQNYETIKRGPLRKSLSETDKKNPKADKETKHLFMNKECIKEIKAEIDYQLKMSVQYGVSGIKVSITSYTNKPVRRGGYDLSQRLTVQFVFTDAAGKDLNLEGIDPRYKSIPAPAVLNTINPTPPYPRF